jgi:hypothetical protein
MQESNICREKAMIEIKFDKRNYRKHNDRNKDLIRKSLNECGAGRSIVVDNNGEIIAGNGIYEQAKELGIKTRIIETDGSELVVVKRTDLSTDDEKRKQLAIMDNSTSDSSEFDLELLKVDFDIPILQDMGIDITEEKEDNTYTTTVNIPQYDVTGEDVSLNDLYDDSKQKALVEEIEQSGLSDEEKEFMKYASYRHIVFNYKNIAEFYAKASPECQKLMENSALVIIDYEDAIKNGYTTLNAKIQEVFEDD